MKQSTLLLLLFFCLVLPVDGQNLVPNFSFEEYTDCPTTEDQVEFATGWSKYSTNNINSTPDYFNSCAPSNGPGVPQNYVFYQDDRRNCSAYMGMITRGSSFVNYREQIGIELSQSLEIGQKYFISFYTVMGGGVFGADYVESPSNNIGLRLSTAAYSPSNPAPIDNFSHIRSESIIHDTLNWVRISGSIVADSSYSYVMLGNFYDDANTDTIMLNCENCTNLFSYYLVDDVCISTDSLLCNGNDENLPCVVSVEEQFLPDQFTLYPNPATDFITIQNIRNASYDVKLYNSVGELCYETYEVTSQNLSVDIRMFKEGIYYLKIFSVNNQYKQILLKQ